MEVILPTSYTTYAHENATAATTCDTARWESAVKHIIDDVWVAFMQTRPDRLPPHSDQKLATDMSEVHFPSPPQYDDPPPPYDEAVHDLPPEYPELPLLAHRKTALPLAIPDAIATKSKSPPRSIIRDPSLGVDIDFSDVIGVREHKKKKSAAQKKTSAPTPPADNGGGASDGGGGGGGGDDQANGDANAGGDAGAGDGAGGAGGGGGGDENNGDEWDSWGTVSGSKKKKSKEEEEEEEKKAAEAAAKDNLSWADNVDDGGGGAGDWAGFAVSGQKKKGKVSLTTLIRSQKIPMLILLL